MSKVGYKNPPKHARFKKGQSGNPKGRPKNAKSFTTLLSEELNQPITITEDGRKHRVSKLSAMVKRIVAGALQGDRKSIMTLVDVMRRTSQFDQEDATALMPDNYQQILDHYVQRRIQQSGNPKTKEKKNDQKNR